MGARVAQNAAAVRQICHQSLLKIIGLHTMMLTHAIAHSDSVIVFYVIPMTTTVNTTDTSLTVKMQTQHMILQTTKLYPQNSTDERLQDAYAMFTSGSWAQTKLL